MNRAKSVCWVTVVMVSLAWAELGTWRMVLCWDRDFFAQGTAWYVVDRK